MSDASTPLIELFDPLLTEKKIRLYIKRDDLNHPKIMGNKWRKLKYNLIEAKNNHYEGLVTMGGAYSNHIAATAAAAKEYGLKSIGLIRGNELSPESNFTIKQASDNGMNLIFLDRTTYRRYRDIPEIVAEKYPSYYFLPEGGTNELAIKGCEEIVEEIKEPFDLIVTPVGTGGTLLGLISNLKQHQRALGISVLKGSFIREEIQKKIQSFKIEAFDYEISIEYHFGGYGKVQPELIEFINWFKEKFNTPLDPIYTGKSFFAVWDMIKTNKFEKNLRIILLHTGGLQGIEGFNRKSEFIIQ